MSKQNELAQLADAVTVDGSNVGIGTSSPNPESSVFTPYLTVKGGAYDGVMQVVGSRADGDGAGVGQLNFLQDANTTNKTIAQVSAETDGATANNRGGNLLFSTKADSGSNTERMRIDSSGRVTKPNQPSFRVTGNTNTSSDAGTVLFSATSGQGKHNIGGHYSTSTGKFTAPVSGVYFFASRVLWEGVGDSDDGLHMNLYINSTSIQAAGRLAGESANGNYGYGGYVETQLSTSVYMSANDNVYIRWSVSGSIRPHNSSTWCSFSGYLLG